MPRRFDLNELEGLEIGGVPVYVAHARGKETILVVGGYDADNLLETSDDCRRYARRLREKIDTTRGIGKD